VKVLEVSKQRGQDCPGRPDSQPNTLYSTKSLYTFYRPSMKDHLGMAPVPTKANKLTDLGVVLGAVTTGLSPLSEHIYLSRWLRGKL
jgi:hypothetical protein